MTGRNSAALQERPRGLTDTEVVLRQRAGMVNNERKRTSRSFLDIVRANVCTRFNAILGTLFVIVIVFAPPQDALFGLVLVANTTIGIAQELRAKRTLDRLAVVSATAVRVRRNGTSRAIPPTDVVQGDLIELASGDQIVVDGTVLESSGLELDESLMTGESVAVAKSAGDELLSGSFVVAGHGAYFSTRVGVHSYAALLAADARQFSLVNSELRNAINRLLQLITWIMLPVSAILIWSQFAGSAGLSDAIRSSAAGIITMVPEGLVLLTSVAFAVGATRLGTHHVLVQELPSIETLARVNVLAIDKTGTLTSGQPSVHDVDLLGDHDVADALGALASCEPAPNLTLRAIGARFSSPGWTTLAAVSFSSDRKWSAARFHEQGTWYLGAPEVLARSSNLGALALERAQPHIRSGRRVLLLACDPNPSPHDALPECLPNDLALCALVVLAETPRPDAARTLEFFASQGVQVKVISGDHPETVGALAASLGIAGADHPVDASRLPEDVDAFADAVHSNSVFGRVGPHTKRTIIEAIQASGDVVAMTGDGVNDVLALKAADIGIAMGSGSAATKAVAQLVLLDDAFESLPSVIAEGRRVIGNIERVANLFLTKTAYAIFFALVVGVTRLPFPFLPRHLTLVGTLTIGVPGFVLALRKNANRLESGFVPRVLRFAVPAGFVAAGASLLGYIIAMHTPGVSLAESRTTATLILFGTAILILVRLGQGTARSPLWLSSAMVGCFILVLAVPGTRIFFALPLPGWAAAACALLVIALAALVLPVAWWLSERIKTPSESP